MAKKLCLDCGCDYTEKVNSDDIPKIIELMCSTMKESMFNIIILNIDNLPNFNTTTQISSIIMFHTNLKTTKYLY